MISLRVNTHTASGRYGCGERTAPAAACNEPIVSPASDAGRGLVKIEVNLVMTASAEDITPRPGKSVWEGLL